jgi:hypothetical protein
VQEHVTRGEAPEGFEDLRGRLARGTQAFRERIKGLVGKVTKEQPARRELARLVSIERIVELVEKTRGESWGAFSERHGDWGRELVLYLARQRSGLTLKEIGEALTALEGSGGKAMEYPAIAKAVKRFEASLAGEHVRRRLARECLNELSIVQGVLPKASLLPHLSPELSPKRERLSCG